MTATSPRTALADLDAIDWAALEHAYGSAEDVPAMLRALAGDDAAARARAVEGLHASLDHQGVQRFESTWRVIPHLIELLAEPRTPDRGAIARLLAELAVGDTCWFLHDGVHAEQQTRIDDAARPQHASVITARTYASRGFPRLPDDRLDLGERSGLRWIYDAVAAGAPRYVAALDGADDELRASIPFLCAFLTSADAAAITAPALERLLDDPVEAVRASAALGLSHACKFVGELRARALDVLSARWVRARGALERRGLALALVRFEEPERTEAVRTYLRAELRVGVSAVIPGPSFPWFRIDSPPFVFSTTYLGTDADQRGELRGPACAALAVTEHLHDAADLALWIARIWVPPPGAGDQPDDERVAGPRRAEDLGAGTLATLRALAAAPAAWHFADLGRELAGRGLPGSRDELVAWLEA